MSRAWILLLAAGCAGPAAWPSLDELNHAPTAEGVERLLRRRWPREFVLELCRWESRHDPRAQGLVPMGDLHLKGVLYPAEGRLGAVHWDAHRFEGELSYQLTAYRPDRDTDGWILEIGEAKTLLLPLTWGEVVLDRVATCVIFCESGTGAYDIVLDEDVVASYTPKLLIWKSPAHGTLEADLDENRSVRVLRLNGREDVGLNRAYRARALP